MHPGGRRAVNTAALVTVVAMMSATVACSTSRDTRQISATKNQANTVVPSTSIVEGTIPTTTTLQKVELSSVPATQDTLSALLSQFAIDPTLVSQIAALTSGTPDVASIAKLLGIDLGAIQNLGLTPDQIMSLGATVTGSPDMLKDQLSKFTAGGAIDPAMIVGLLTSSLDMNTLAQGAIGSLIQAITKSLGEIRFEITPEVTVQLSELFKELDPNGLGHFAAEPANASLLALITSAVISANPLLAEQLLTNPLLDPALKDLLVQLQQLSTSLSDAAKIALFLAINQLFPGLIPQSAIPGA